MRRTEDLTDTTKPIAIAAANNSSSSNSSSSSVSSSASVSFSNRRSNSDVDRKTLESYGITNKDMQKTFLSLRAKNRKARIGLSCVNIPKQQPVQHKCEDIIGAVAAMQSTRNITGLLPVQLMARHGLSHIEEDKHDEVIYSRLDEWAEALRLPPKSLYPLIHSPEISVTNGNLNFNFQSWAGDYLPEVLKIRIDQLTLAINALLSEHYQPGQDAASTLSIPILACDNNPLKPLLKTALTTSLTEAGIDKAPPDDLLEQIFNSIIYHALLAIAHRHPKLSNYAEMLASTNKEKDTDNPLNIEDIGTQMFFTLSLNRTTGSVRDEFAHGIAYGMEELCSPEIIKQLASVDDVMIYIPVSQQVRRNNHLRLLANWLKPSNSAANIEPCNSYETREQREEKTISDRLDTQSRKTPSPENNDAKILEASILIAAEALKRSQPNANGMFDPTIVTNVFNKVSTVFRAADSYSDTDSTSSTPRPRERSPSKNEEDKKPATAKPFRK